MLKQCILQKETHHKLIAFNLTVLDVWQALLNVEILTSMIATMIIHDTSVIGESFPIRNISV